jgi:hypothetical protein
LDRFAKPLTAYQLRDQQICDSRVVVRLQMSRIAAYQKPKDRQSLPRLVVEISAEELAKFDEWAGAQGYTSRSDATRAVLQKVIQEAAAAAA